MPMHLGIPINGVAKSLTSFEKGIAITNALTNVTNSVANVHTAFGKNGNSASGGGGYTINNHYERQLTDEEIKIKQEQHEEAMKRASLERGIIFDRYSDEVRQRNNFLNPPEKDHNMPYYILGGVFVISIFFMMVTKKKKKQ